MAIDNTKQLALIITIFIALLIGVILLGVVADEVYLLDAYSNSSNESITMINDTFVELEHGYIYTWYELRAHNNTVILTDYYDINYKAGLINISSYLATIDLHTNESFYADYLYYNSALGFERSNNTAMALMKLITLFFALGLLGVGLMFIFPGFRDLFG